MMKLVECVPNISEGRDQGVIDAVTAVIEEVEGVRLLDVDPGADTNRTVITFIGPPEGVAEAAFRVVKRAGELIDMRQHKGAHPRHGSTDVCPFVPVRGVTMEECAEVSETADNKVVPADDLEMEARRWATVLAAKSPVALQIAKSAFYAAADLEYDKAFAYMNEAFARLCTTHDAHEGVKAFCDGLDLAESILGIPEATGSQAIQELFPITEDFSFDLFGLTWSITNHTTSLLMGGLMVFLLFWGAINHHCHDVGLGVQDHDTGIIDCAWFLIRPAIGEGGSQAAAEAPARPGEGPRCERVSCRVGLRRQRGDAHRLTAGPVSGSAGDRRVFRSPRQGGGDTGTSVGSARERPYRALAGRNE